VRRVRDIASARSGDKGDTSSIAVTCHDIADYPALALALTPERMATALAGLAQGPIRRHEVPGHGTLVFVIERALDGGVSRSLRFDPHGKTLSSIVLTIEIPTGSMP
jgi:hypothetical protein